MSDTKFLIVGNETGEIVRMFDCDKQYIRNRKQDDFLKQKRESSETFIDFNNNAGKFIWSYPAKIKKLIHSPEFTKSDLTMIFYLATYVNGNGFLVFDNQIKLKKSDLKRVLKVGRNTFNKLYNKLVNHHILNSLGSFYTWNDNYNFYGSTKGKAKPNDLIRTYIKQIRELYEAKNEKGHRKYSVVSLYPIFALVPYLHHSTNIICFNPEEKEIDEIKYMSLTEVAKKLDLKDSKKMSKSLSSILLAGQSVFRMVVIRNEKYLQMNPRFFWKGITAPDKKLIAEFDMVDNRRKTRNKQTIIKSVLSP